MQKFIRTITVKVVGVSYKNDDGSNRQSIISKLESGDILSLEYHEYNGEPAYYVTTIDDDCIGNLPKDLAFDIFNQYSDHAIDVTVNEIIGGTDGLKYGCVVDIDLYSIIPDEPSDTADPIKEEIKSSSETLNSAKPRYSYGMYKVCGFLLCFISVLLFLLSLTLLFAGVLFAVLFMIISILIFVWGRNYLKIAKSIRK